MKVMGLLLRTVHMGMRVHTHARTHFAYNFRTFFIHSWIPRAIIKPGLRTPALYIIVFILSCHGHGISFYFKEMVS